MSNHITHFNSNELCHPDLRTSFKTRQACAEYGDHCLQKTLPCNSCCEPAYELPINGFAGESLHYNQPSASHFKNTEGFKKNQPPSSYSRNTEGLKQHLHHLAHSCPLGKIILCEQDDGRKYDQDIVKAKEICLDPHEDPDRVADEDREIERVGQARERPCCAQRSSWTEPRICRCDMSDPVGTFKNCECECGAAIMKPKKERKRVRFEDEYEKPKYIDCDKAFRNLDVNDIKELCSCCKECAVKCQDGCGVCKPVLVYELPEAKFEDKSITQNDFGWQKAPQREIPPWHPNIKDRWKHLDVPSLAETTYQNDFKRPPVLHADEGRNPVYLAPQREEIDPCQKLAEEYCAFKKTSTGPNHVYHSSCENCDKDLHRVHLHECDVSDLPPQYRCHGDGHICDPQHDCHLGDRKQEYHGEDHGCEPECRKEEQFTLCEIRNPAKSRYWWKRSCPDPVREVGTAMNDLSSNLKNPACPDYVTMYKKDFKNPMKIHNERTDLGNCSACDYCTSQPYKEPPPCLCTKDTRRPFITQRAAII